ncbi:hepatic sodium/bile acid cotransporter [Leptodactylus fuscus]|uniref:hepatic sodium/bile acid cotransporter n=1 Tax=Leptodactylus fuscus TaxID=238119 RepID=UPI003F4EB8A3
MNETTEGTQEFEERSVNVTDFSQKVIGYALDTSIILLLVMVMMSFGCTLKYSELKKYFLKPKEVGIAVLAQYGFMPLSAFSLAHILRLSSIESLIVLLCGCCPGGNLSNVFSSAIKGNMNLSILMTVCSTVLALGMMPLLLYVYCLGLNLGPLHMNVPFQKIVTSLTITIVPCFLGALLNSKRPRCSQIFIKVSKILGPVLMVEIFVLFYFSLKSNIFKVFSPKMIGASLLLPFFGYVLGYTIASIFRLPEQAKRTICMETGCQNAQLCATILKISFDAEVLGVYILFPLLFAVSQILLGLVLIFVFRLRDKIKAKAQHKPYVSVDNGVMDENLNTTNVAMSVCPELPYSWFLTHQVLSCHVHGSSLTRSGVAIFMVPHSPGPELP